jgi:Fungal protein kinase
MFSSTYLRPWPANPIETNARKWFLSDVNQIIYNSQRQFYSSFHIPLKGNKANRKVDLMLCPIIKDRNGNDLPPETEKYNHQWGKILVVGELKVNEDKDHDIEALVQFIGYAREVFGSQPERRFLHGFSICGHAFRSWIFDHSGVFSSTILYMNNNEDYKRVLHCISEYSLMNPKELGYDVSIQRQIRPRKWETYMTPKAEDKSVVRMKFNNYEIELQEIIWNRPCIASRSTVVRGGILKKEEVKVECIIKDHWPFIGKTPEGELWEIAKTAGVWGLAKYEGCEKVKVDYRGDETKGLIREGLQFEKEKLFDLGSEKIDEDADGVWNREHWRLVFLTKGEPLSKARSIKEMLEALRDAVHSKIPSYTL